MKFELQSVSQESIERLKNRIEGNSVQLESVVQSIIKPYCEDLDKYVNFVAKCLQKGNTPPTNEELEDFCMNLSTCIYFAGGMCEYLGIKDDIAKAVYKEVYNTSRDSQTNGTVADKDSRAALDSQEEQVISLCYTRAYKIMKSKVENAQELLQSCKKVLSHRMQEEELTHIGGR